MVKRSSHQLLADHLLVDLLACLEVLELFLYDLGRLFAVQLIPQSVRSQDQESVFFGDVMNDNVWHVVDVRAAVILLGERFAVAVLRLPVVEVELVMLE